MYLLSLYWEKSLSSISLANICQLSLLLGLLIAAFYLIELILLFAEYIISPFFRQFGHYCFFILLIQSHLISTAIISNHWMDDLKSAEVAQSSCSQSKFIWRYSHSRLYHSTFTELPLLILAGQSKTLIISLSFAESYWWCLRSLKAIFPW